MNKVFEWPVRVYYEDTDAGGVVYHANYLKFMERARTEWLRALGFEQDQLRQDYQRIFVVRALSIEYLSPARFNDALIATAEITEIGKSKLEMQQYILSHERERILTKGQVQLVYVHSESFRPQRITPVILDAVNNPL
ncbi:tol-pal system-associated acyl-CoA thioesterase [Candidatus Venteria ishoeyi]|uniref:tol-pal system-associated acyl-CoA thioesterase n=2 Tax=Candidatus Venteria ishoeyi TaxID=1899563 RepID=UPI0025A5178F|nr:tol-pal system-associated acyl-CoA thioesterase [Candidatus Venteria ishoeyi]MDM8545049.1 tol-pal system-associated acyl-CoA thioesterase [Candidatus Venteria ishoeyi]